MFSGRLQLLPWLAIILSTVRAIDLADELAGEWKMGLRPRQETSDLQTFEGALGASAPAVTISAPRLLCFAKLTRWQITNSGDSERPFEVDGDTFVRSVPSLTRRHRSSTNRRFLQPDFESAASRACDNQKNACAEAANSDGGDLEVSDCDDQNSECHVSPGSSTSQPRVDALSPIVDRVADECCRRVQGQHCECDGDEFSGVGELKCRV